MQPIIPYFTSIVFDINVPAGLGIEVLRMSGFGFSVGLGLIVANILVLRFAKRSTLDVEKVWMLLAIANLSVLLGGSVGHGLLYSPRTYMQNPTALLDFRRGLSSIGGILLAVAGFLYVFRRNLSDLPPYADAIAYGFVAGWPVGRFGCILNHEHIGTPSNFILARFCRPITGYTVEWPAAISPTLHDFRFSRCLLSDPPAKSMRDTVPPDFDGIVAVHDMALYEALFALFLFLYFLFQRRRLGNNGRLAITLVSTYSAFRFLIDFLRSPITDPRYAGLTAAQWGAVLLIGIVLLLMLKRRAPSGV